VFGTISKNASVSAFLIIRPARRTKQKPLFLVMSPYDDSLPIVSSLPNSHEEPGKKSDTPSKHGHVKTRLVLHMDINETILLGDVAGGDSRQDSLNKMLAKSAWVQIPTKSETNWDDTQRQTPTHWWDGQELGSETSTPPLYTGWAWPKNCCPYYRTSYKSLSRNFVEHHGKVYKGLMERCTETLAAAAAHDHNSPILPALYYTLHHLVTHQEQPFTVVFRTFGDDLPNIAEAVNAFFQGKNPDYPQVGDYANFHIARDHLFQGRWKLENGNLVYQLWDLDETKIIASGDQEILQLVDEIPLCGIRDDYPYWEANRFLPNAGKPVWVPHFNPDDYRQDDTKVYDHHVLFDDNIHNLSNDGIACIRQQLPDGSFSTLESQQMHTLQGIHMIRVPTVEPLLNPAFFVEKIDKARTELLKHWDNQGASDCI
jgi:hypothetical protein